MTLISSEGLSLAPLCSTMCVFSLQDQDEGGGPLWNTEQAGI